MSNPIVSVCCYTYNHENYIREALDGFLMQKTNFPFEILIHDDASSDETAGIIRMYQEKYPDLIKAVYQTENQYSQGKRFLPFLFKMAQGKYIALCEGDDYWTDPLKLQKQVDFLESHPECSLCCHRVLRKSEFLHEKDYLHPKYDTDQIFTKDRMYGRYILQTCTLVFRNIQVDEFSKFYPEFKVGDYPLFYFYAQLGHIGYLHDVMAVYRIHKNGVSSGIEPIKRSEDFYDTLHRLKERLNIKSRNFDRAMCLQLLHIIILNKQDHNREKVRKYVKIYCSSCRFFSADYLIKVMKIFYKYCKLESQNSREKLRN